jgi:hypothetical protein
MNFHKLLAWLKRMLAPRKPIRRGMLLIQQEDGTPPRWHSYMNRTQGKQTLIKFYGLGENHEALKVESVKFASSNPAVVRIVENPEDPASAYAHCVGVGEADITATADGIVGEGEIIIAAEPIHFVVHPPHAVAGEIVASDEETEIHAEAAPASEEQENTAETA